MAPVIAMRTPQAQRPGVVQFMRVEILEPVPFELLKDTRALSLHVATGASMTSSACDEPGRTRIVTRHPGKAVHPPLCPTFPGLGHSLPQIARAVSSAPCRPPIAPKYFRGR